MGGVNIVPFSLAILLSSDRVGGLGLVLVLVLRDHSVLRLVVLFRLVNLGRRARSILSPRDPRVRAIKASTATRIHS